MRSTTFKGYRQGLRKFTRNYRSKETAWNGYNFWMDCKRKDKELVSVAKPKRRRVGKGYYVEVWSAV